MKITVHMFAFMNGKTREVKVPDQVLVGTTDHKLNQIYYYGQNDFHPSDMCSVSMGDIIEYDGELYLNKMIGFEKMTKGQFDLFKDLTSSERLALLF